VDTHHHLWQTQLKGRHADHGLVSYMYTGTLHLSPLQALRSLFSSQNFDV
jgi:hypothetical protein